MIRAEKVESYRIYLNNKCLITLSNDVKVYKLSETNREFIILSSDEGGEMVLFLDTFEETIFQDYDQECTINKLPLDWFITKYIE